MPQSQKPTPMVPQDHDDILLARGGAPAALIRNKDHLLDQYRRRVREQVASARAESTPILIDTLPAFFTRLAIVLTPDSDLEFASEYSNIALQHGNERARFTDYTLAELIKEYQIVREILMETFRADASLSTREWDVVHRSIDEAMGQAASAFVEVYTRFRDLFTATLSHDFRGPLSNAMNYLELIRRDAEPEQRGHFAARSLHNLKRVDRMIGELLDVTRSNAGARLPVRLGKCDAGVLMREVIDELAAGEGRFVLKVEQKITACWDCERIKQALHNVVENAVKYGRVGSPITCQVLETHGRVIMSVHNEGDAIPAEYLTVLFQPFRRSLVAEKSGKPGWGLGLVLVQAIAEAHGGSVAVESTAEQGTTFSLDILLDVTDFGDSRGTG